MQIPGGVVQFRLQPAAVFSTGTSELCFCWMFLGLELNSVIVTIVISRKDFELQFECGANKILYLEGEGP